MNIIDFTKGIGYNIIRFPDGEVHLQLNELDRREPVKVVIRICNAEDLFLFMQLSDILHRQDVVVEELHIPYLMSMRCDRVFSFDRPFSLKIVSKTIRDMGARQVFLYEPHSSKSSTMTYASVKEITREYAFRYANTSTICYPDKGAQVRYNLFRNDGELLCEKVRDVTTGELLSFKVTNPEEFNGEEITVIDDLCDGGGTFVGIASELRKLNPTKLRLVVTHAVNYDGILKVASVYDEVVITNSYKNWGANETLPNNVRVNDIISKL
jgi:ribose-phosphate pyrophosphokinase